MPQLGENSSSHLDSTSFHALPEEALVPDSACITYDERLNDIVKKHDNLFPTFGSQIWYTLSLESPQFNRNNFLARVVVCNPLHRLKLYSGFIHSGYSTGPHEVMLSNNTFLKHVITAGTVHVIGLGDAEGACLQSLKAQTRHLHLHIYAFPTHYYCKKRITQASDI